MKQKNLMEKLASRKLWVSVLGAVSGMVLAVSGDTQYGVATIIASVLGYVLAEGIIDANGIKTAFDVAEQVKEIMEETEDK